MPIVFAVMGVICLYAARSICSCASQAATKQTLTKVAHYPNPRRE
jgi:hypothetical protein